MYNKQPLKAVLQFCRRIAESSGVQCNDANDKPIQLKALTAFFYCMRRCFISFAIVLNPT